MENKIKYREFCKKESAISLFSQPWWLDAVCGQDNWGVALVEKGGNIFASMPYYAKRKYGLTVISPPKLTQTLDIYFKYPKNQKYYKKLSFEKEMVEKILAQLPKFDMFLQTFNHTYTNLLPFYWAGFDSKVKYTYVIDNMKIEELEKNLESDIRRRRRKANEAGVIVYESDDVEKFYEINEKTFTRKNKSMPYTIEFIKSLYSSCKENDAVKIFFAKHEEDIIAASFLVYDESTVYYIMGGIDPEKRDLGGMDMVQYESISFALASGKIFDFEGSMIESIEKYFRSFGSTQKPYFQVSKINSKILKFKELIG